MTVSPSDKRQHLREKLAGTGVMMPGAYNALCAKMIAKQGFEGVYISGAAISASAGMADIGLLTATEFCMFASYIVNATDLPTICDADTGFGSEPQVARTVRDFEAIGLSGLHIEDQVMPKRCGHLNGKELVSTEDMCLKIQAAVAARKDPNFLIIARTDARAIDGIDGAITRAKAYIDAGADVIFPEALQSPEEFQAVGDALPVPLLANMTEFGKSPSIPFNTLSEMGYKLVIYPVSTLRISMKATEAFCQHLHQHGSQTTQVDQMQTRQDLYDLLEYDSDATH